ncbi:hypothetical protein DPMN_163692 [Dreissena polymorpha]|uniref:Sulfotransferase domain-containing protein n=1 Tax=Dreissena polymorpha TaxID=45954 RepID=A0A9D4IUN0_DREPO|nr:hypothetical protein DPMN_163692 [Dreissena polymorpha]
MYISFQDLPEAIRQIASHLDVKVTEKDVATLTEHCSFSNMKQNPSTNASWIGENSYVDKQFGGHIRKGKLTIYQICYKMAVLFSFMSES